MSDTSWIAIASLTLFTTCWTVSAQVADQAERGEVYQEAGPAAGEQYKRQIEPLLAAKCQKCHGNEKAEGDFLIGRLSPSMSAGQDRDRWTVVLTRVKAGEMPPQDADPLSKAESESLAHWIEQGLQSAILAERKLAGRTALRRLNRIEYENTVCDLLGIKTDLKELLALDGSADGFDNVGSALHISSSALEKYLEAGQKALSLAIANSPQPDLFSKRMDLSKERNVLDAQEAVYRFLDEGLVLFSSSPWNHVYVSEFYPRHGGRFRIRVSASAFQSDGKPVTFRLVSGELRGKNGLIGYFDAPAGQPKVIEVEAQIEPRTTITILPYGQVRSTDVTKTGPDKYKGPGVAIHWVEIEGPLYESWPPPSHVNLFGDLPQKPFPHQQINGYREVVSDDPERDASTVITRFLRKAFRRPIGENEVETYLKLFRRKLEEKWTFEESIRVALLGVLASDDFLYLREAPGQLDDYAIASRLSYFLWSSCPDDELSKTAEFGGLKDPAELRRQTERMLNDPKADAFTENFVGQWLGLRGIDATEPNYLIYPEFDHMLKVSMIRETEAFFAEVLKEDLSVASFIHADFSMLNARLARHYGVPGPDGFAFERVPLPKDSHRGGVLTMASVLKVTANGSYTHPVHRGVWVLERILGQRPPNPPANVPVIEPDVRGAKGIREQLAKHREGSCASCHARIDPPGFALESFDVIGGWRENYRTTGLGEDVEINGQRMSYLRGPRVECDGVLPDGRSFANIDEYKQRLLTDLDQVTRALAKQLVTYATGSAPAPIDSDEIEELVAAVREKNYGLRSMIHAIVASPLFQQK